MLETTNAARMCPTCGEDSAVYDSRVQQDGRIFRKRRCPVCGMKFQTEEKFLKIIPTY